VRTIFTLMALMRMSSSTCSTICANGAMRRWRRASRAKILLDPGIGFGKTLAENLALINALPLFHALGQPILFGASRKRMIVRVERGARAPAHGRFAGGGAEGDRCRRASCGCMTWRKRRRPSASGAGCATPR
jgi:hypothetical protein